MITNRLIVPWDEVEEPYHERYNRISDTSKVSTESKGATRSKSTTKSRRATRRATKLCWPTKGKKSKKAKTTRKSTPFPFSRLPAELRAKIWAIAFHDQISPPRKKLSYCDTPDRNFVIIHQDKGTISVQTHRGYPTLFFVNREARYEAAKLDGGAWYSLGVGAAEVYANFNKEDVYVCDSYKGPRSSILVQKARSIDQERARRVRQGGWAVLELDKIILRNRVARI